MVLVPALDLLWQGPAERLRPAARARAVRLALFPFGIPLVAGPAALAATIAWAATEGAGVTVGGAAMATAVVAAVATALAIATAVVAGRASSGAFTAVAMAFVAFDLVRDGVIGT